MPAAAEITAAMPAIAMSVSAAISAGKMPCNVGHREIGIAVKMRVRDLAPHTGKTAGLARRVMVIIKIIFVTKHRHAVAGIFGIQPIALDCPAHLGRRI